MKENLTSNVPGKELKKNQLFDKKVRKRFFPDENFKNFKTFFLKTESCFLDGERNLEKITVYKIIFTKQT